MAVEKVKLEPVQQATVTLTGLESARYRVEFWNPEEGKLIRTMDLAVTGASLEVPLPEVQRELAVKVRMV